MANDHSTRKKDGAGGRAETGAPKGDRPTQTDKAAKAAAKAEKAARAAAKAAKAAKGDSGARVDRAPRVDDGDTATAGPWYLRYPAMRAIYKAQKNWRREAGDRLELAYYRLNVRRAHAALRRRFGAADGSYDTYLREQLEETLRKRKLFGRRRFEVIPLVDMLASKYDFGGQSVLCVGCRDDDELRYFRKRGAGNVVGIDLYDAGHGILTMDMHDLQFADGSFEVVYSRHSFEHAYDKRKAGAEFVRVLKPGGVVVIEVPGKIKGGGDYNLFNGFDDVLDAFTPHVGEFLWKEYSRKEENTDKMDIIRLMFRVRK
jgi:SAM-dependent methyltransferase